MDAAVLTEAATKQGLAIGDGSYQHVAVVGDRRFTDVLMGNAFGCVTVLVPPLDISRERAGTGLFWRPLEAVAAGCALVCQAASEGWQQLGRS